MENILIFLHDIFECDFHFLVAIISFSIIVFFFLLCLILSLILDSFYLVKNKCFLLAVISAIFLQLFAYLGTKIDRLPLLTLSISALLFSILTLTNKRKINPNNQEKEKQLQLAKHIDSITKCNYTLDNESENVKSVHQKNIEKLQTSQGFDYKRQNIEIDFSHIKNILCRLPLCKLSIDERNSMDRLMTLVNRVEGGEEITGDKKLLSDGLSQLIKIMAKYGL